LGNSIHTFLEKKPGTTQPEFGRTFIPRNPRKVGESCRFSEGRKKQRKVGGGPKKNREVYQALKLLLLKSTDCFLGLTMN
jgi:hypothetical protein